MTPEIEMDELDRPFQASQPEIWFLMVLSLCWVSFQHQPVIPIGLIATLYYVGKNYETTFVASWKTGWRLVIGSVGVTLFSWFSASASLNFGGLSGRFSLGLIFELARWVDWLS